MDTLSSKKFHCYSWSNLLVLRAFLKPSEIPCFLIIIKAIVILSLKNLYHWEWNLTRFEANLNWMLQACLKQTVNWYLELCTDQCILRFLSKEDPVWLQRFRLWWLVFVCVVWEGVLEYNKPTKLEWAVHSKQPFCLISCQEYPFILDPFQKESLKCLENNQSVLVSAHTSAGKTVVAE